MAVRSRCWFRVAAFHQQLSKAASDVVRPSNLVRGQVEAFVTKSRERYYPNPQYVWIVLVDVRPAMPV
jgi:hypothetical protein